MTARRVLIALALVFAVSILSLSAVLRWQYGVWLPLQPPAVVTFNEWGYRAAWEGDFERMASSLKRDGEPIPKREHLVRSGLVTLPPCWSVFVDASESGEAYPETIFVRTLDGAIHPYGYVGMPPQQ